MMGAASARSSTAGGGSLEAELQSGALLQQQTAAVDYYLATAAPKWNDSAATASSSTSLLAAEQLPASHELRALFLSDMTATWQQQQQDGGSSSSLGAHQQQQQAAAVSRDMLRLPAARRRRQQPFVRGGITARDAQLEQFLQEDVLRLVELQEQLHQAAGASDAAVLSSTPDDQRRRLSSRCSNSSISFVRLPECGDGDDVTHSALDDDATPSVAAALAAATAIAAVDTLVSSPESPSAALRRQAARHTGAAAEPDTAPQQPPAAAAAAAFAMEPDEEIAAQKVAARSRLAELQQQEAALGVPAAAAGEADAQATSSKAWLDVDGAAGGGADEPRAGSLHSSVVPERPRGLAAHGQQLASASGGSCRSLADRLFGVDALSCCSREAQQHQVAFVHIMRAGLLLCVLLLPALPMLQQAGGGPSSGSILLRRVLPPLAVAAGPWLYLAGAACGLIYCLVRAVLLQPPLLHFAEPGLERRYLLWANSGKRVTDCLYQATYLLGSACLWQRLAAGADEASAAGGARLLMSLALLSGSGLPVATLLLMRSPRYLEWREALIAGSRVASVLGLSALQLALPAAPAAAAAGGQGLLQLSMPFVALAQLMIITCMQVRLATFVPGQIVQVVLLLFRTRGATPLLHLVQLLAAGLCLPCLLLHRMELHLRRAFLASLAPQHGKPAAAHAGMLAGKTA